MGLPTRILFDTQRTFPQPNVRCLVSGKVGGNPQPEPNLLYEVVPPTLLIDGISPFGTDLILGWRTAQIIPVSGNSLIFCDAPFSVFGTIRPTVNDPWIPYAISGAAGSTVQLPQDLAESVLFVSVFALEGENLMAGKLGKYNYTSDGGTQYVILMDKSNGDAVGNNAAAANAVVSKPNNLVLRYLLAQQTDDPTVKRKIAVCAANNSKYISGGNIDLETVNGTKSFKITGRVGEKYTF